MNKVRPESFTLAKDFLARTGRRAVKSRFQLQTVRVFVLCFMMDGYKLSRCWFDFAFEKKEAKYIHTAIFMWAVELNNRLSWKPEFGLPTHDTMEGLSIGNKNTYLSALKDLETWGFIKIIAPSKNQFQACIISIIPKYRRSDNATALDTALIRHCTQHGYGIASGIDTIDKPRNQETIKPRNHNVPKVKTVKKQKTSFAASEYGIHPELFCRRWQVSDTSKKFPHIDPQTVYDYMKLSGEDYQYADWLLAAQKWVNKNPDGPEWKKQIIPINQPNVKRFLNQ